MVDSLAGYRAQSTDGGHADRCTASHTCPKISRNHGRCTEFWGLKESPSFVGTAATVTFASSRNVRRYHYPGRHTGRRWRLPAPPPRLLRLPALSRCMHAAEQPQSRGRDCAGIDGTPPRPGHEWYPPPPSRYPTLAGHNLVAPTQAAMGFPNIPECPVFRQLRESGIGLRSWAELRL